MSPRAERAVAYATAAIIVFTMSILVAALCFTAAAVVVSNPKMVFVGAAALAVWPAVLLIGGRR